MYELTPNPFGKTRHVLPEFSVSPFASEAECQAGLQAKLKALDREIAHPTFGGKGPQKVRVPTGYQVVVGGRAQTKTWHCEGPEGTP